MTELRHLLGLLVPSGEGDGPDRAAAEVDEAGLSPQPGVAQIPSLLARVRAAGMPAELAVTPPAGTRPALPPGIDLAAYRVVQEALTNVIKHAGQTRSAVRLEYRPDELLITVTDDGRPADEPAQRPGQSSVSGGSVSGGSGGSGSGGSGSGGSGSGGSGSGPGRGLIGLRERIALYGGELDAGPRPGGGWRVSVRIPLEPVAEADPGGEDRLVRTGPAPE
jgi:signal transduction histidine kinase